MNDKIRQLADQLGPVASIGNWGRVSWADEVYPQHGDKMYAAIDLERFAELIVAECARVADATSVSGPPRGCTYGNVILEHFGVAQ